MWTPVGAVGLGAVLYQEQSPIASRKLSNSEQKYPIHQFNFLPWNGRSWINSTITYMEPNSPYIPIITHLRMFLPQLNSVPLDIVGWLHYLPTTLMCCTDQARTKYWCRFAVSKHGWRGKIWGLAKHLCDRSRVHMSARSGWLKAHQITYVEQLGALPECIPDVYAFPIQMVCDFLEQKELCCPEESNWSTEAGEDSNFTV